MQGTVLRKKNGQKKEPIGPVTDQCAKIEPIDSLEQKDKLQELIALEGPMKPRETKPGFNWVASNHGAPLPKDTTVEEFVCAKCKLCIAAMIEILPPTRDRDDPGRARITVNLIDPDGGAVQETLLKDVVICDSPDGVTDREKTAELSCNETDFYLITIGFGCLYEEPQGGENDRGAGSVRIEVRSIKRTKARR